MHLQEEKKKEKATQRINLLSVCIADSGCCLAEHAITNSLLQHAPVWDDPSQCCIWEQLPQSTHHLSLWRSQKVFKIVLGNLKIQILLSTSKGEEGHNSQHLRPGSYRNSFICGHVKSCIPALQHPHSLGLEHNTGAAYRRCPSWNSAWGLCMA